MRQIKSCKRITSRQSILLWLALFLFPFKHLHAQGWEKVFEPNRLNEQIYNYQHKFSTDELLPTSDNGCLFTNGHFPFTLDTFIRVTKLKNNGNLEWKKYLTKSDFNGLDTADIGFCKLSEDTVTKKYYLFCIYDSSNFRNILIFKINTLGIIENKIIYNQATAINSNITSLFTVNNDTFIYYNYGFDGTLQQLKKIVFTITNQINLINAQSFAQGINYTNTNPLLLWKIHNNTLLIRPNNNYYFSNRILEYSISHTTRNAFETVVVGKSVRDSIRNYLQTISANFSILDSNINYSNIAETTSGELYSTALAQYIINVSGNKDTFNLIVVFKLHPQNLTITSINIKQTDGDFSSITKLDISIGDYPAYIVASLNGNQCRVQSITSDPNYVNTCEMTAYFDINDQNRIHVQNKVGIGEHNYDFTYSDFGRKSYVRKGFNGNYFVYGVYKNSITNDRSLGIMKLDEQGNSFSYNIQGKVYTNNDNNCIPNTTETGMPFFTVRAIKNGIVHYGTSYLNGNYFVGLTDTGAYTIAVDENVAFPLWKRDNCAPTTNSIISETKKNDTVNFGLDKIIDCPNLRIDISTPILRRCYNNVYYVNYCNNGTQAANASYIDITLDPFLTIQSASIPFVALGNNIFRFQLGTINTLQCDQFTFVANLDCNTTSTGQTHCVEAHIYPDTVCLPTPYTGPILLTSGTCNQSSNSIDFKIKNDGGNMPSLKKYIVIEDDAYRIINGNIKLNNGEVKDVPVVNPKEGSTYTLLVEQDNQLPGSLGDSLSKSIVENCINYNSDSFTHGIPLLLSNYDGEPFRSVECQQSKSSYDPNNKKAMPIGWDAAAHYIFPNTDIEYQINFQNTGNDTAFYVNIIDTIDSNLDINTLQPGVSSHRYTYHRLDSNTVQFEFDNIRLVDSSTNELQSHGFIKFRIKQKKNLPNDTRIENNASIYFDFNADIQTNTTWHTIGTNFIELLPTGIINHKNIPYQIFPNPFSETANVIPKILLDKNSQLLIYDMQGKWVRTVTYRDEHFEIHADQLSKGIYNFSIIEKENTIGYGKIVIQ